ncbi:MAG TPA: hypothetical protein VMS35_03130 [Nitrososphaeraceae archaeon]|nr:hypothetical protein [Nitrososphaeraceae archaeon]
MIGALRYSTQQNRNNIIEQSGSSSDQNVIEDSSYLNNSFGIT